MSRRPWRPSILMLVMTVALIGCVVVPMALTRDDPRGLLLTGWPWWVLAAGVIVYMAIQERRRPGKYDRPAKPVSRVWWWVYAGIFVLMLALAVPVALMGEPRALVPPAGIALWTAVIFIVARRARGEP